MLIKVRAFIRHIETGQIGVIVANDSAGGIFRGHADCWFGEFLDAEKQRPKVVHICLNGWDQFDAPHGYENE